eukprot:scaffold40261_cov197-Isochrysis_galbana.AAC.1
MGLRSPASACSIIRQSDRQSWKIWCSADETEPACRKHRADSTASPASCAAASTSKSSASAAARDSTCHCASSTSTCR